MVWMDVPRARDVPPKAYSKTRREMALWARSASASSVTAVLAGPRGRIWQQEDISRLVSDKLFYEAKHDICRYDWHENNAHTRCGQIVTYSNLQLQGMSCKCAKEHPEGGFHSMTHEKIPNKAMPVAYRILMTQIAQLAKVRGESGRGGSPSVRTSLSHRTHYPLRALQVILWEETRLTLQMHRPPTQHRDYLRTVSSHQPLQPRRSSKGPPVDLAATASSPL